VDGNKMTTGGGDAGESNILDMTTLDDDIKHIYKIIVWVYGKEDAGTNNMTVDINFGGWVGAQNHDLYSSYGLWTSSTFNVNGSQADLDALQVKYTAAGNVDATHNHYIDATYCEVFYQKTNLFNKYMAREFRGNFCMNVLKAVCELEDAHWYEDYINNQICIIKPASFVDSTVDLTEADYEKTWQYTDECNQIKSFYVYGKSEDSIFAKAVDESVAGYISKQLIDESITNVADAQEIADTQLTKLKTKRPSIKLPLKLDNVLLQLGTTVGVTLARPTVAATTHIIRMIERKKVGIIIKTVIYCGLGESPWEEKLARTIRDNADRGHKSLTDRLISP